MTDEKPKRRPPTAVIAAIGAIIILLAIIIASYATLHVLFPGVTASCFTNNKKVAASLNLDQAGKVLKREYKSQSSYGDCANPRETITISGNNTYLILNRELQNLGYTRVEAGVWTAEKYDTRIIFDRVGGNTILYIDADAPEHS